jgi:Homeodomain-like domain-containing protein
MTTSYYAERANLYRLQQVHPQWSHQQLAATLGRSREWVKKWRKRFREEVAADLPLEQVLQGHGRARIHPPPRTPAPVVERVLSIRDAPPQGLRRVPGPEAIAYYLHQEAEQEAEPLPVPSCRTIYRLLKAHQRIAQRQPRVTQPVERPAPLSSWQLDFKDVSTVPADPLGKQQHVVETRSAAGCGHLAAVGGAGARGFHRRNRLSVRRPDAPDPGEAAAAHLGSRSALGGESAWQ